MGGNLTQVIPYFGVDPNDKAQILMFNSISQLIGCVMGMLGASLADKYNRRTLLVNGTVS